MTWTKDNGKFAKEAAEQAKEAADYLDEKKPLIDKFTDEQTNLQAQINQLVVEGDSSPEAAQARVGVDDTEYSTLKARLDAENEQVTQQLAQIAVQPESFGAVGDGITDDRSAVQEAIDYVSNLGGGKVLLSGKYKVSLNGSSAIVMRSNVILEFSPDAELNAFTNNTQVYDIIRCFDISNFKILNGTLNGDKATSTATMGHGHGIGLYGVEDYHIDGTKIKNTKGDGILVGWISTSKKVPKRGVIERFEIDGISRNGISIISCDDLVVRDGTIKNVSGSDPQSGIDVEPYLLDSGVIKNLRFKGIYTKNNKYGIIISCYDVSHVDVELDECIDESSATSSFVFINNKHSAQTGQIIARNLVSKGARNGINIDPYSNLSAKLIIERPKIINYNPSSLAGTYSSGILIADTTNIITNFGNIEIIEPYITTKQSVGSYPINIVGNKGRSISIINPIRLEDTITPVRMLYTESGGHTKVIDNNKVLVRSLADSDATISGFGYFSRVSTELMTAKRLITLSIDRPIGDTITIDVLNSAGVQITGAGGEMIYPLATANNKRIESVQVGSSITLKRVTQTGQTWASWQIINQVGTWTLVP